MRARTLARRPASSGGADMSDGAAARALVLEAPRSLVVREFPIPIVGDDDALVRVTACGLCGTDHEQ